MTKKSTTSTISCPDANPVAEQWLDRHLTLHSHWVKDLILLASTELVLPSATSRAIAHVLGFSEPSRAAKEHVAQFLDIILIGALFEHGPGYLLFSQAETGSGSMVVKVTYEGDCELSSQADLRRDALIVHQNLASIFEELALPETFRLRPYLHDSMINSFKSGCLLVWNPADGSHLDDGFAIMLTPEAWARTEAGQLGDISLPCRGGLAECFFHSIFGQPFCTSRPCPRFRGDTTTRSSMMFHETAILPASSRERWACVEATAPRDFVVADLLNAVEEFFGRGAVLRMESIHRSDAEQFILNIARREHARHD